MCSAPLVLRMNEPISASRSLLQYTQTRGVVCVIWSFGGQHPDQLDMFGSAEINLGPTKQRALLRVQASCIYS